MGFDNGCCCVDSSVVGEIVVVHDVGYVERVLMIGLYFDVVGSMVILMLWVEWFWWLMLMLLLWIVDGFCWICFVG